MTTKHNFRQIFAFIYTSKLKKKFISSDKIIEVLNEINEKLVATTIYNVQQSDKKLYVYVETTNIKSSPVQLYQQIKKLMYEEVTQRFPEFESTHVHWSSDKEIVQLREKQDNVAEIQRKQAILELERKLERLKNESVE